MENKHGYKYVLDGKDTRPDDDYDKEQLKRGIEVEKEHTLNEVISKIIAKDHLDEFPNYYTGLDAMEAELEKSGEDFKPDDLDVLINNDEHKKEHTLIIKYSTYVKNIAAIGYLGNVGHSYAIILDPDGDNPINSGWDGDGSDHIFEIIRDNEVLTSSEFKTLFK